MANLSKCDSRGPGALLLLTLAFLPLLCGCEATSDYDRPFAVFENIPDWLEGEFRRGGDDLENTFDRFGRTVATDSAELAENLGGIDDLVDREVRTGRQGLAWQGEALGRTFDRNAQATEENLLGAPGWVSDETERNLGDLERFLSDQGYRARVEFEDFTSELTRFFGFLFR